MTNAAAAMTARRRRATVLAQRRAPQLQRALIEVLLFLAAASSVAITFAIVAILVNESLPLLQAGAARATSSPTRSGRRSSTTPTSASCR
ncbi:MAG: hypothetical protein MZW92_49270 [Comamonadaceae bacterium]|nr:hypothetical protein [Comamonadaceae bacterium]